MPAGGSVSGASVSRVTPGERFPRRALPPWAQVRTTIADSVALAVACLISYWLTTSVLSLASSVSRNDDALGGTNPSSGWPTSQSVSPSGLAAAWLGRRAVRQLSQTSDTST